MIDFFEVSGMTPEELDDMIEDIYLANKDSFSESLNDDPRYQELQDSVAGLKQKLIESLDSEKKILMEEFFEKMDLHLEEKKFDKYKKGFKMGILLSCLSSAPEEQDNE